MRARIILLLFYFFWWSSSQTKPQRKRRRFGLVFHQLVFQELPLFAASKRGFFPCRGTPCRAYSDNGIAGVAVLLSGDVDYITHNSRIIATAVRGGVVKSVFNYVARPIYYLLTLPEIKQAKEIQGRTVGVSTFGGGHHRQKLKEKRDEVRRVLRALLRSLRFVNDDREGSKVLLIDVFKMPNASAGAAYDFGS